MHSQFIFLFLFLLHKAIVGQENLSPPAPNGPPVIPVAAVASASASVSVSGPGALEARDGDGKYVHYHKRQEVPFPTESSNRLISNDGASHSVTNGGFLKSGHVSKLLSGRNALEIDARGVVRIKKQFDLSTPVDDAVPAYPEPIEPDDRDPARDGRPEEKGSLEKRCEHHANYLGVSRLRDIYHRNRLAPTGPRGYSDLVGRRAAIETEGSYPMLCSNSQIAPKPSRILGEGEGIDRPSASLTPPCLGETHFNSLVLLDGESTSEDVGVLRMGEDRGGYSNGANLESEYPLYMGDNILGTPTKGATGPVTTRSESEINRGLDRKGWLDASHSGCLYPTFATNNQFRPPLAEHKSLPENVPSLPADLEVRGEEIVIAPSPPGTSDPSFMPLLGGDVVRGVSSAEIASHGAYKLQRGDDGGMRSVLMKRLDASPGSQQGLGRPTRSVGISHDGGVYAVDAAGPIRGSEGVEIRPVDPITVLEEASPILGRLRPANPVSTPDNLGSGAVGSQNSRSVSDTSDDWGAKSIGSFHPFESRKGGGRYPNELVIGPDKKLATLGKTGGRALARRSHSIDGRSQVSLDLSPSGTCLIELGDDGGVRPNTVKRRSNRRVGNTADFEPVLPDSSLGAVHPAGRDGSTPRRNARVPSSDSRVSIDSPLMTDQNGRVYHKIIQARSGTEAHVFDLPGLVSPIGIRLISVDNMGQLLSKDLENGERICLFDVGDRTTSGSAVAPAGCPIGEGIDGELHPRSLERRSVDGSDYIMSFSGGNPIQLAPELAQAMDHDDGEAPVGIDGETGASGVTNMANLFHSINLDKLAVVLPLAMFGTLLLVLAIFGMAFCCLRQSEETYHINIRAIESRRPRNRSSRRRRKNRASTGAAEEGDVKVPPGAPAGQPEVGNTNRGWFFQRWYDSLRGDAAPKTVSFSGAGVVSQRSPRSNLRWARGLDGGQDTRDPSYILDAVSDRLQQTRAHPGSLSTIWSDGGPESSATAGTVLATGRKSSGGASIDASMMSRRMHGAKGDNRADFRQEFASTIEGAGLSGNLGSGLAQAHSPVEGFTGTSNPVRQEPLSSDGAFRMIIGGDLSIPDSLRERKEISRVTRPDTYISGPGTESTYESSEPVTDMWIEDNGAIVRRREGDTREREDEVGPSRTVGDRG